MTERILAAIDIGTNSVRLQLVRIQPNGSYTIITKRKEAVRLGEGEFRTHRIQPEPMQRAVLVCKKFADMARGYGAHEILAFATAATREAENKREFLRKLKEEAGLHVRVISGKEEARLIHLGVSSNFNLDGEKGLFIDIGGGSTELIVGDQQKAYFLDSLRVGAIQMSSLFLAHETDPISTERYQLCTSYVRDISVRAIQNIQSNQKLSFKYSIGSSGTIENLCDIAIRMFHNRRREPEDVLTFSELRKVVRHLRSLSLEERRQVDGINPHRADIILGGAAIIETLMESLNIKELHISDRGLWDGMLIDYLEREGTTIHEDESSFRASSVLRLGRAMGFNEEHARNVAELALALYDSAGDIDLHPYGEIERELLEYACLLHDIGVSLSYNNHQTHSYYFIRNADLLGFDQREIDIIALTALYHRKKYPKKKHREFNALDEEAQEIVRTLCVFLSIAESLDRSHMRLVRQARFAPKSDRAVLLQLDCEGECMLEIWGVEYHEKAFRRTFKKKLVVEPIAHAEAEPAPVEASSS